jgi:hypothetical protein
MTSNRNPRRTGQKVQPHISLTPPFHASPNPIPRERTFSGPPFTSDFRASHGQRNSSRSTKSRPEDKILDLNLSHLRNDHDNSFILPSRKDKPGDQLYPHQPRNREDWYDAVLTVVHASRKPCGLRGVESVANGG